MEVKTRYQDPNDLPLDVDALKKAYASIYADMVARETADKERKELVRQHVAAMTRETVQKVVEIDAESLEEVEIVHCPICTATDPWNIDDFEHECQACGAIYVLVRGRQDLED